MAGSLCANTLKLNSVQTAPARPLDGSFQQRRSNASPAPLSRNGHPDLSVAVLARLHMDGTDGLPETSATRSQGDGIRER